MKQKQYRADYEAIIDGEKHYPDSDFFSEANDEEAIEWAKHLASEGVDYADVGHVDTELTYVAECDDDWNEIGVIYY